MIDQFNKLSNLYSKLPPIPCKGCGKCCVSPTCTFIEFTYLIDGILKNSGQGVLREFILKEPEVHPGYDGNLYCRFQDRKGGLCLVHPFRTMACRLFGLPAINDLGINDLENCTEMDAADLPQIKKESLETWLSDLSALNDSSTPFYREPYWVAGLNIECWLAVYFNPLLDDDVFGDYKKIMRNAIDLSFVEEEYTDTTLLKEKTEKIYLLNQLISLNNMENVNPLISSIRNDFPITGTYFLQELEQIENYLDSK